MTTAAAAASPGNPAPTRPLPPSRPPAASPSVTVVFDAYSGPDGLRGRRFALRAICRPKSREHCILLTTVRSKRLGRQSPPRRRPSPTPASAQERPRLRSRKRDPFHQARCQFPGVKSQRLPQREKKTCDSRDTATAPSMPASFPTRPRSPNGPRPAVYPNQSPILLLTFFVTEHAHNSVGG